MKKFLLSLSSLFFAVGAFAQTQEAPAEKTSNANLVFETSSHSFGNIIEGQIATYEFKFTNTGTEPLELTNVRASCGCTTPKWPRELIQPGQTNVIRAEYNSSGRPGTFSKNIFVTSNAGQSTLTISGNVIKEPEKPVSPIIIK
jgi:hypothetical protein